MKVLVVSDSHGRHDLLRKAIGQEAPIDMLIHAGDIEGDLERILGPKREYSVRAVAGNMDLDYAFLRGCMYGDEQNDILLLNPGSVSKPRQAGLKKTYAVITIDDQSGEMKVRFKSLRGVTGWA